MSIFRRLSKLNRSLFSVKHKKRSRKNRETEAKNRKEKKLIADVQNLKNKGEIDETMANKLKQIIRDNIDKPEQTIVGIVTREIRKDRREKEAIQERKEKESKRKKGKVSNFLNKVNKNSTPVQVRDALLSEYGVIDGLDSSIQEEIGKKFKKKYGNYAGVSNSAIEKLSNDTEQDELLQTLNILFSMGGNKRILNDWIGGL